MKSIYSCAIGWEVARINALSGIRIQIVYVYPDELALSYERVPEWLRVINSPDERYFKSFIRKLGVLTPESSNPIKLREVVYNYAKGGQEDE